MTTKKKKPRKPEAEKFKEQMTYRDTEAGMAAIEQAAAHAGREPIDFMRRVLERAAQGPLNWQDQEDIIRDANKIGGDAAQVIREAMALYAEKKSQLRRH